MIKSSSLRAAAALSGSAIALTAAMLPAQAATSGWRVSAKVAARGTETILTSVDAVGARDAWVTGFTTNSTGSILRFALRHWTGKSWRTVALPTKVAKRWNADFPIYSQVAASSVDNVWVVNSDFSGSYLHLNGKRWSTGSLLGGNVTTGKVLELTTVKDFGKNNAWAFGAKVNLSAPAPVGVPYAARFSGRTWTGHTLPGKGAITAVSATSATSMWAVVGRPSSAVGPGLPGGTTHPLVLHWTAKAGWQQAAPQPVLPAGANLTSVVAQPDGTVWVGGSVKNAAKGTTAFAAKWTAGGSVWTLDHLGGASSGKWELVDMAADGPSGIWAVALAANVKGQPARLWHLSGATWTQVKPAFGKHEWILAQLAAVPGTASVWGVGALKAGKSADGLIAIDGPTP